MHEHGRTPDRGTLQPGPWSWIFRGMRQRVHGEFAAVEGLPEAVERARRERGLSWLKLAEGSGWSRQYLQRHLQSGELQASVVEYLQRRLGLSLSLVPTSPLLEA